MARVDPIVKSKLAFLRLAEELGNVAQACRVAGYSRDTYYRLKKLYETGGEAALRNHGRTRHLTKNQVSQPVQQRILELAFEQPATGQKAIAEKMSAEGLKISPNGVRSVWLRYEMETRQKRMLALKAKADQGDIRITGKQLEAIQVIMQRLVDKSGKLVSLYPGYIIVQDTLQVDHFPDLGPLFLHIAVDSYSSYTFARYCTEKTPEASSSFLKEEVLPWFDEEGITIQRVLTDRGAEFYRPRQANSYQTLLKEQGIEHLLIKAYNSAKINGLCHQFADRVEADFFPAAARLCSYEHRNELQDELDLWLGKYNNQPQQTRYCYGKTPTETLNASRHLCQSDPV